MNQLSSILISSILLFSFMLNGIIVTHKSHKALADYIAEEHHNPLDIIVVFDIDNTLAHPLTEVGSDQWLEHKATEHMHKEGITHKDAYRELLPLYYKVQHLIDLDLVEDMIPALIEDLKNRGITVIGLTARHHPIIYRTLNQLTAINITFTPIREKEHTITGTNHDIIYNNGILFCGNNNKGESLWKMLEIFEIQPQKIYCIDDKLHHLEAVEKETIKRSVACTCIHYLGCAERVEQFNAHKAHHELMALLADQPSYCQ